MRTCTRCLEDKTDDEFYAANRKASGKCSHCKDCMRHTRYVRTYGISTEVFVAMQDAQKGLCAACGSIETRTYATGAVTSLCVDHDHVTGRVRALLCHNCNTALGHLQDDPDRIKSLLSYLIQHTD